MIVDEMVKQTRTWLTAGASSGVVISSRIRLARNIRGYAFPGWATADASRGLCGRLREVLQGIKSLSTLTFVDMGSLTEMDRDVLCERHLISPELADKGEGSALAISEEDRIAIMINEEDHLRLQAIHPGMHLVSVWDRLNKVDSELEQCVPYAYSERLGYLTACPTNVGTGLRASVMVNLSGLRLLDEIEAVAKGLDRLGLAVRGLLGEGTDASGNMFQISNQSTLGESEAEIIKRLLRVVGDVVKHEQRARMRLLENRRMFVLDQVGRAYGILMNARVLPSVEAIDLLSGLRLGVEFGMVKEIVGNQLDEIMLMSQPAHLQKMSGRVLEPAERDEIRARFVRDRLSGVRIVD